MLSMAFFKSLVKEHGVTYFEPVGKALAAAGIKRPNPLNPAHAWALKDVVFPYLKWLAARRLLPKASVQLPDMPQTLRHYAEFACRELQAMALEISQTMSKFQLKLADRQCKMVDLSSRCQDLITVLCTAMYGARESDPILQTAAEVLCQELIQKYTGKRPTNRYFQQVTQLGAAIAEGRFPSLSEIEPGEIMMRYDS